MYLAGQFNAVDGVARKNVAAIDPATGALLPFAPKAQPASSVYASATNVYVGGLKLASYQLDGTPTPGYVPPEAIIDPSLRSNPTKATFRDIEASGSSLVVACQCDSISDAAGVHATKALVQIDAASGLLLPWTPSNLQLDSAAFGIDLTTGIDPISGLPTVYLAAGGSDFSAAYDLGSGAQIWKTDTSGSSQAITIYQGDIVVGGHFDWTESPTTPQCGKNADPTPGCYHTPRLVALDPATGDGPAGPGQRTTLEPGHLLRLPGPVGGHDGCERHRAPRGRRVQEGGRRVDAERDDRRLGDPRVREAAVLRAVLRPASASSVMSDETTSTPESPASDEGWRSVLALDELPEARPRARCSTTHP